MTYNILSIDMDYILKPCINLYNDLCKLEEPKKLWDKINEIRGIDKHLSYDEENLMFINKVFFEALVKLKDKKNVTFAINHDAILYELKKEKYDKSKFNIYNIDHHHDISFSKKQSEDVDKYDFVSIGNWGWYLDKYEVIENFIWIKNENSLPYKGANMFANFEEKLKSDIDIFDLSFDYIFVCKSPQWTPNKYEHFFYMLKHAYESITGNEKPVEIRNFCEGSMAKKFKE